MENHHFNGFSWDLMGFHGDFGKIIGKNWQHHRENIWKISILIGIHGIFIGKLSVRSSIMGNHHLNGILMDISMGFHGIFMGIE